MGIRDRLHIMVVDDMSTSRGVITQALDSLGVVNYTTAEDGDEAYRALATRPVHLVISDYNMPKMDGLQLLHALRSNKSTQKIGFILVTGRADQRIIDTGKQLSMNNYLEKPFDLPKFKGCIESVVGPL